MSTASPAVLHPAWGVWAGAALLTGLALYALLTESGASPRYPLGLIALALSNLARHAAVQTSSRRLDRLAAGLIGVAGGLMVGGFLA